MSAQEFFSTPTNQLDSPKDQTELVSDNLGSVLSREEPVLNLHVQKSSDHGHDNELHQRALNLLAADEILLSTSRNSDGKESDHDREHDINLQLKLKVTQNELKKKAKEKEKILEELSLLRSGLLSLDSNRRSVSKMNPLEEILKHKKSTRRRSPPKKASAKSKDINAYSLETQEHPKKRKATRSMQKSLSNAENVVAQINLHKIPIEIAAPNSNLINHKEKEAQGAAVNGFTTSQRQERNLENQLKMVMDRLERTTRDYMELERAYEELRKESNTILDAKTNEIIALEELNLDFKSAVSELNRQVTTLSAEKAELANILEQVKAENEHFMLKNKETYESVNTTAKLLTQKKDELANSLRVEVQELQQALEKQRELTQQREKILKSQIVELQNANGELAVKVESLQESLSDQTLKLSTERAREEKSTEKLKSKLNELQINIELADSRSLELETECKLLKTKCLEYERQKQENLIVSSQRADLIKELEQNIAELNEKNVALRSEIAALKAQNQALKLTNSENTEKLNDLMHSMGLEKQGLIQEKEKYQKESAMKNKKIQELEHLCNKQEHELQEEKTKRLDAENKFREELLKCKELSDETARNMITLEAELNKLRSQETKNKSDGSKEQSKSLREDKESVLLANEKERHLREIEKLRSQFEKERASLELNLSEAKVMMNKLQKQTEQLTEQNSQLLQISTSDQQNSREIIQQKNAKIIELAEQIEKLTQNLEQLKKENSPRCEKTNAAGTKQEHSNIEEIQNLVLKYKLHNDSLKEKYESALELNTALESNNAALSIEIEKLKKQNFDLGSNFEQLREENERLSTKFRESEVKGSLKEKESYTQQITELEAIVKEHEATIKKLSKEIMHLKQSNTHIPVTQIQATQKPSESIQLSNSQSSDKMKETATRELRLNSIQTQNTQGEETPVFKDYPWDSEGYFAKIAEDRGLVGLILQKGSLESNKKDIEERLAELNKDLIDNVEQCRSLYRHLTENPSLGPGLQQNNELVQQLKMILNENKEREKQQIVESLKERIQDRNSRDEFIGSDSSRPTTKRLKLGSEAEIVTRRFEENQNESFGGESVVSEKMETGQSPQRKDGRSQSSKSDLGSRVISQEFKIRKYKEYFQKLTNELENKNNTIELLKQSLKVRMEKTNDQIEDLKQKHEKAVLEVERRFEAIEESLKEHLMSLVHEAARFKKVNLTRKEAEDARNIFLEIKRILVETLEENASLASKKKSSPQKKDEATLDHLRMEVLATNNELDKKRVEIENLQKTISKYSEEQKAMKKVFDQALRVRTVLTPIKEEQLKEVLKADSSTKALVNNTIFIKDAMIYHLFLSDYVFAEPEIPIRWTSKNKKSNQEIEMQEQIQSLKDQVKAKEAEILAQAKTWSSVITKLDKKLKKLIILGKQEGVQTLQLEKVSSEPDSPRGGKQIDDKSFAEKLAQKLQTLETIIQNSNEIREKYAK